MLYDKLYVLNSSNSVRTHDFLFIFKLVASQNIIYKRKRRSTKRIGWRTIPKPTSKIYKSVVRKS